MENILTCGIECWILTKTIENRSNGIDTKLIRKEKNGLRGTAFKIYCMLYGNIQSLAGFPPRSTLPFIFWGSIKLNTVEYILVMLCQTLKPYL